MRSYLPLIIGMAIVTYIPRLIPLIYLTKKEPAPNIKRFLQFIPYTSLGILIVRGIITSSPEMLLPTIIGIGAAGAFSYVKGNLVFSVMIGILASFIAIHTLV